MDEATRKRQPASFFSSTAVDHAVAGLGAGVVTTLVMNPLDLLKIKFQVSTTKQPGGIGMQMWSALRNIQQTQGWRGLYRGISPNIAGNASSWGLYFLFYNMLKKRAGGGDVTKTLSAPEYLLCSAQASAVTAIITNPFWLIRVRMFATTRESPNAYRGLWDGLTSIYKAEGVPGLFRGTTLALVGVSNGAIQFMAYEKMKAIGFERKRRKAERTGVAYDANTAKLSNFTYSAISIGSKLIALATTYPYQVVRSRIQVLTLALPPGFLMLTVSQNTSLHQAGNQFSNIPATIKHTWANEGVRGFYRGLGTSLVRVLPGTCVTFVVYENLAWLLRTTAATRAKSQADLLTDEL